MEIKEEFDFVLIGSGPVSIFEAVYLSKLGKKVLIIDKANTIGGSWAPISFAGIRNIENAVHYLWNDKRCCEFLFKTLNVEIVKVKNKIRVFKFWGVFIKLKYDSWCSKIFKTFFNSNQSFIKKIQSIFFSLRNPPSIYFKLGSPDFIKRLSELLYKENIQLDLKSTLSKIDLRKPDCIFLKVNNKYIKTSKLYISNSSRLPEILTINGTFKFDENISPRPSIHILIKDFKPEILECIFENDSTIKYVHDITKFSSLKDNNSFNKRILVFALKENILFDTKLPRKLISKLIAVKMLSKKVVILDYHWQDFVLPVLSNETMDNITTISDQKIINLKTDTLSESISFYSRKWDKVFKK